MITGLWNYFLLKRISRTLGVSLFGVADISDIKADIELPENTKKGLNRAVCLGVSLSGSILTEIQQQPTKLYFHHYKTANMFLDQMAFNLAGRIQRRGARALSIPASQIIDWEKQRGHLSHKKIGIMAGMGWLGRNNLLVSKEFGSQFRVVTILTDLPLKADRPVKEDCGSCFSCLEACPVAAIGQSPGDFNHLGCFEKLKSFQRQNIVGQFICGVCVKVCGRKYGSKHHTSH